MDNSQIIWNYFRAKGLSEYGVAGLMGNLQAESGLDPKNLQNSFERKLSYTDDEYTEDVDNGIYTSFVRDGAGYGLAQWTYWSRKQNLLLFAHEKNTSIGDINMQLDFLYKELKGQYAGVLKCLTSAKTIAEASDVVLTQFEKPAVQNDKVKLLRQEYGQGWYDKYADKPVNKYYRIQVGAFSSEMNARKLQDEVINKGFSCIVKKYGVLYKCQIGAFSNSKNADNLLCEVKKAGFANAFITYC